jgi:plastocyanin
VLQNYPTLSLGFGLPTQLAVGLDFSSNSEIVPTRINGNEFQLWIAADVLRGRRFGAHALAAWNSAARSADGAVTFRAQAGPLSLLLEARGFQDALGQGKAGAAGAVGAVWRLTPMLELSADAGRMLAPDSLETVWSAGLAIHIPGSPHTLGLHATNGGALTLQGASRPKVVGSERVRYGFVFTVPLGSWRQWGAIVRRSRAAATSGAAALVELRGLAFQPRQVRIRAGQSVEWINHDPVPHTVTATATTAAGPAWGSGVLLHGDRYVHTFPAPGRYRYTCLPHPQMTGVVIVEP